ncbi:hypothetical protein AAID93_00205 [Campylobacter coli]
MEETQSYFSEFEIRKIELINFLEIKEANIGFNFYLDCIEISNATICKFDFKFFDLYKLSFVNCIFECPIFNSKDLILDIQNNIFIDKCIFKNRVDINDVIFRGKLDITLCIFETKCCFYMNAFFEFCNFKDNVFNDVRFEKNRFLNDVMFYNSDFNMFNFSQSIFKGSLNVVNTNLNFTFDDLQEKIKQEYEDFNKTKEEQDKKPLDKLANDFRDSFRNFKSALIKDNNLLDASNFHKYELYCKELELKNKKDKTLKDKIDKWQLFFYRKLCDHHTDLLLNLRWLVVVVGFFVSVLFVLRYGDGNLLQFFNKDNDLLKILKAMLNIKVLNDSNVTYLILLYSFIGLFFVRTFFIFYYLVIFILMLAISPYNLFSVVNFVTKDQSSSFLENIIMVAYALIMILVLFSLQKTARKNSIVPS